MVKNFTTVFIPYLRFTFLDITFLSVGGLFKIYISCFVTLLYQTECKTFLSQT